ncbi:unnamed protein product [Brassica oleracea var. botrytis]
MFGIDCYIDGLILTEIKKIILDVEIHGKLTDGIQSLESRVSGLEMALDELSCDLAVSIGRVRKNSSCGGESCSKLRGTEFLSPKFWRKTEERPMQTRTRNTASEMAAQENSFDQGKTDVNNFGQRGGGSVYQKRSARNQFQDSMHTSTSFSDLRSSKISLKLGEGKKYVDMPPTEAW